MLLITVGSDHIGGYTVLNLIENNCDIIIFYNLKNGYIKTVNILSIFLYIKFIREDLKKLETLLYTYLIYDVICSTYFNLVKKNIEKFSKYYISNIDDTLNLLNTIIKHDIKKIVLSSICTTYEEKQKHFR